MINESQSERLSKEYVRAELNPSRESFQTIVSSLPRQSIKYFEVGCGQDPKISVRLEKGDLWVGCDPAIIAGRDQILLSTGTPVHPESKRIVYSDIAAEVPQFSPDFFISVAPNPKDVAEGKIINYDLEKFLDNKKTQFFYIIFDNRTFESQEYKKSAIFETNNWMFEHKFQKTETNPLRGILKPNSADLGAFGNKLLIYSRNPKK